MKNILLILLMSFFILPIQAQETKTRKEIRAEKKSKQLADMEALRVIQEKWAADKTFVLEAQQVFNKANQAFQLNSSINFVHVNQDKAIIQLGFDGLMGWNGVGGITIKGRITRYEFNDENKSKPIYIKMSIQGSSGLQDITLWVSSDGNGEAQITDIKGNRIRFTGQVLSIEESSVFVGMESF